MQQRAERWDFLSRYLGDGVRLSYAGTMRQDSGRIEHVLLVEDLKFGGKTLRAYFDKESHLLTSEELPAGSSGLVSPDGCAG